MIMDRFKLTFKDLEDLTPSQLAFLEEGLKEYFRKERQAIRRRR